MKQSSRAHIKNSKRQCSAEVYANRAQPQHSVNIQKMNRPCQGQLVSGLFRQEWKTLKRAKEKQVLQITILKENI